MGISAAVIGAAGVVGGSAISAIGQNAAANTAANAANTAAYDQMKMYQQTRSDLSPYMQTGNSALSQLSNLWGLNPGQGGVPNASAAMSQLTQMPGYQFGMQQGTTASNQSAAAEGLTLSGGQQQALQTFGNNYALQQAWNPYVSQLNSLTSLGENAAAGLGNQGTTAASNAGTATMAAGSAAGAGQLGVANTLASGASQLASQYGSYANGGVGMANWSQLSQGTGYGSNVAAGDPLAGLY